MKRTLQITEMLFWTVVAFLIATHTNDAIIWALTCAYGSPMDAPRSVLSNLTFISPVFPLFLGVIAIIRLKIGGINISALIGYSNKKIFADVAMAAVVAVSLVAISIVSMRLASKYAPLPPFELMPPSMHLFFATFGAVIPGVFEEIYFRGMMLRVGGNLPTAFVLLMSAAAFSLWHIGTPAYLPHTFIVGLVLGLVFIRTGRLIPAILAHSMANAGIGVLLHGGFKIAAAS